MTPPKLPDLETLTDAQKNELILGLWQTLQALDEPAPVQSVEHLRERIRTSAPPAAVAPVEARMRLGRGLRLLESPLLLAVLLIIGAAFVLDLGIGWYQRRSLERTHAAALALENAAFGGLTLELLRVEYEPDGRSYRATIAMQNGNGDTPLYIMFNPVRVFVQTGLTWQEVPAQAPDHAGWGVLKLTDAGRYQVVFQANVKDWAELMPGYMHVRIQSDMLISQRAEPGDDIVERNNSFYVYLKPQGADDTAIKRRANFPGTPPVFIPMPPH